MDAIGIDAEERRGLQEILWRHRNVRLIACGHVHRAVVGAIGPATSSRSPSTDMQLSLDFSADALQFVTEPPCSRFTPPKDASFHTSSHLSERGRSADQ
jgi:3',5'-cyclic-AMP phosphodiesterase